ncbi:DUF7660 family protein [Paenibacillus silvisoli]|uniref:DUF7660 family protein n=1 Tax=Paenibacillus silvisoli TaxID=3110539 RepID=UPI002804297F|nr:hypothetical protein [Paenibacillus silvisoli]
MQLHQQISEIRTKEDFLKFLSALRKDLVINKDQWENPTLEMYLEAMEAWIDTMEGYYSNTNQSIPEQPTWKVFADILYASKIYE